MKKILFFATAVLSFQIIFAQPVKRKVPLDSLALWEVRKVAHNLELDSNQIKYFAGAMKNQLAEFNNIRLEQKNDSNRIIAMKKSVNKFNQILKEILTKAQLEKYTALQEVNKNEFIQKQNKSKVKIKSLDIAN